MNYIKELSNKITDIFNKLGYKVIFASAALLFHHESATRKNVCEDNHKYLCKKCKVNNIIFSNNFARLRMSAQSF